jgi:hypothetical protein
MLPRVAREYGHRWCAASASSRVAAWSRLGTLITSVTTSPYMSSSGPTPTWAVTVEWEASTPAWRARPRSALWKQAA